MIGSARFFKKIQIKIKIKVNLNLNRKVKKRGCYLPLTIE